MQKRFLKLTSNYLTTASKVRTWSAVEKNNWTIKFSIYNRREILLIVISKDTGQTLIRFFKNEDLACSFLNLIIELDSNTFQEKV